MDAFTAVLQEYFRLVGELQIRSKLEAIADMKQSVAGHVIEFITYGQRSLTEKKASAMWLLALELAEKYGYKQKQTWGEFFDAKIGHFEKEEIE